MRTCLFKKERAFFESSAFPFLVSMLKSCRVKTTDDTFAFFCHEKAPWEYISVTRLNLG